MIRGFFKLIFGLIGFIIMFSLAMAFAVPLGVLLIGMLALGIILLPFRIFFC